MNAKIVSRMMLTIGLLAVIACGQFDPAAASTVALGQADNGREVRVAVGQTLKVSLPCSAGSGYSWRLASDAGPQLALVSSGMGSKGAAKPGSSESQDFLFEARSSGMKQLRFEYVRPWQSAGADAAKTYSVVARIEK